MIRDSMTEFSFPATASHMIVALTNSDKIQILSRPTPITRDIWQLIKLHLTELCVYSLSTLKNTARPSRRFVFARGEVGGGGGLLRVTARDGRERGDNNQVLYLLLKVMWNAE